MRTGTRSALLALLILGLTVSVQARETTVRVGAIEGTLLIPDNVERPPVAVLIAGSGPTDRDGNGPTINPATLKKLAQQLALRSIASLRYDKRGSRTWDSTFGSPEDFRFAHFVDDAAAFAAHLRADGRFAKLILIGHSEGALVACLATQRLPIDGVVLLSGPSRRQGDIIKEQLKPRVKAADYEKSWWRSMRSWQDSRPRPSRG